jgi:nucleoside-diphosphate-sugar epimerase
MRAIVTGGAGFIGSHLAEELIKRDIHVSIWDNLSRGRLENISHILGGENRFLNLDLALHENIRRMADIILAEQPALIFHYAAINGTQYFYDIPARVLEVNTIATHNLMLALREVKKSNPDYRCKIIYASSSEVYSEPLSLPSKETDITYVNIEQRRDSYAVSKLAGEFYVKLIAGELGIDFLILRLFNVYGPRMVGTMYGQVIPEFIKRLSEGEYPLKIFGNGEHKRSFCYISDNTGMSVDLALSGAPGGVYNIGGSDELSILNLADIIMTKMGKEPKYDFLPEREGDHKRRCPDTSKLHAAIGKRGYVPLDEGLRVLLE